MVRIRCYDWVLMLPTIMIVTSVIWGFIDGPTALFDWSAQSVLFCAGVALQILFGLVISCPQCGKSPWAIGPSYGPFALAGKPWPDGKCSRCGYDLDGRDAARKKAED